MPTATTTERTAQAMWEGDLPHGHGTIALTSSGAASELPVTWGSRAHAPEGRTSPEELLAAAHASCFSMALSNTLAAQGHAPERLEVSASVTFDVGALAITSSQLRVRGAVPGCDRSAFEQAARAAAEGCPVSGALRAALDITVDAELQV